MKIFETMDYREYIRHQMTANGGVRGYQKRLAAVANCQSSFISQALNSHVQLTPDQAAAMSHFWRMEQDEAEYFIGLVNYARAATSHLRSSIKSRLDELRRKNQDMAQRFKKKHKLSLEDELLYYSAWYYTVIHVITTIPQFQTAAAIAERLNLSLSLVESVLASLASMGLVKHNRHIWTATEFSIHLPKKSRLSVFNHSLWRQFIVMKLQDSSAENLHYTAIHSMGKKDFEAFRAIVVQCIDDSRKLVEASPEEEMVCFTCDFIKI